MAFKGKQKSAGLGRGKSSRMVAQPSKNSKKAARKLYGDMPMHAPGEKC